MGVASGGRLFGLPLPPEITVGVWSFLTLDPLNESSEISGNLGGSGGRPREGGEAPLRATLNPLNSRRTAFLSPAISYTLVDFYCILLSIAKTSSVASVLTPGALR